MAGEIRVFVGMVIWSVLCHDVNCCIGGVLLDPVEDWFGAAVDMVREDEMSDDEFCLVVRDDMVSLDDLGIMVNMGESFSAFIVSIFEISEIKVNDSF